MGKYNALTDAYRSLMESLTHGGAAHGVSVRVRWVDAEEAASGDLQRLFAGVQGILAPGGFGVRGARGKMQAAHYARTRGVPWFGICFGMQMAVVEAARNLAGLDAGSTELGAAVEPVVGLITQWRRNGGIERRDPDSARGGTMRLGAYDAILAPDSRAAAIYEATRIRERHRHRYEINIAYRDILARHGFVTSGLSPDGQLPEIMEIPDHPWFIGVQFHPEMESRPFTPHPLFASFVRAALEQGQLL